MHYLPSLFTFLTLIIIQTSGITVTGLSVYKTGEFLAADVKANSIIDEKHSSALLSGLPLHLHLSMKITDTEQQEIRSEQIELQIRYDVWDEFFVIRYPDRETKYKSMDSLRASLTHLTRIHLWPLKEFKPGADYYLHIRTHLLNSSTGSVIDSMDQDRSKSNFSLSAIIRFFFGNSKEEDAWFRSDKFRINELESR